MSYTNNKYINLSGFTIGGGYNSVVSGTSTDSGYYGIILGGKCSMPGIHKNCGCNDYEVINGKNYKRTDIGEALRCDGINTLEQVAKKLDSLK